MIRYGLYLFDLDGTLIRGKLAIPGAPDAVQRLRDQGAKVRFVTNNSSQTVETSAEGLRARGFALEASEIYTSALAAARVLHGMQRVFVVGEEGLRQTLISAGIEVSDQNPEAVVVGIDREFTYAKMQNAMQHLLNPNVRFIATNRDLTYPVENGGLIPGAGSVVAAIAACSGREPEVIGKPSPLLFQLAMQEAGCSAKETLVIGDRVDTDIAAGLAAGCPCLLVLSGVTKVAPEGVVAVADVTAIS